MNKIILNVAQKLVIVSCMSLFFYSCKKEPLEDSISGKWDMAYYTWIDTTDLGREEMNKDIVAYKNKTKTLGSEFVNKGKDVVGAKDHWSGEIVKGFSIEVIENESAYLVINQKGVKSELIFDKENNHYVSSEYNLPFGGKTTVYFELKKDTLVMFNKNFENVPVVFVKNQD
jgi:hypothetical protein